MYGYFVWYFVLPISTNESRLKNIDTLLYYAKQFNSTTNCSPQNDHKVKLSKTVSRETEHHKLEAEGRIYYCRTVVLDCISFS